MHMLVDQLDEEAEPMHLCNGAKSLLQQDVTMRCMHTITDDQA